VLLRVSARLDGQLETMLGCLLEQQFMPVRQCACAFPAIW
jgi:hypothetical protein